MQCTIVLESFSVKNINQLIQKLEWFFNLKTQVCTKLKKFWSIQVTYLPTKKTKYTLLKSPHVNKKAKEQFESNVHKRLITIQSRLPLTQKSFWLSMYGANKLLQHYSMNSLIKSKLTVQL